MTGLKLKGAPVSSGATKARTQRALEILEEIQKQVAAMGLSEYPKPKNVPAPLGDVDLGALENSELESLLASYTGYASFINTKLAEAEVAYKVSTANMKAITASLKASLFKDGTPKGEVDALVATAPEYVEYELEHLKLYATKEILESHYKAYSRGAQAVSRIVELRKLDYEQSMREHNVGRMKRPNAFQGGGAPRDRLRRP
jgi:hypothetical protein